MPLRDHFRPPTSDQITWAEVHGGWPMVMVQELRQRLPPGFKATPRVQPGMFEVDVAAYEHDPLARAFRAPESTGEGGVAIAPWTVAEPAVVIETEIPVQDLYEVRVYDARMDRRLVAAIELVSPRNKDRPESRNAFVGKCAALLREGVAVSIVDVVTNRNFNLYAELLAFLGLSDRTLGETPPATYAASCRWLGGEQPRFEAWPFPMAAGEKLPVLPILLSRGQAVPLDLEACYERTCDDLGLA